MACRRMYGGLAQDHRLSHRRFPDHCDVEVTLQIQHVELCTMDSKTRRPYVCECIFRSDIVVSVTV